MIRTSIGKMYGIFIPNYLLLPCHLHHTDTTCMPVSVDNVPEYKDPQAHSASEHNRSFLPGAKHMPPSLSSGDL